MRMILRERCKKLFIGEATSRFPAAITTETLMVEQSKKRKKEK